MNRLLVCLACLAWLSACEPKAPEPAKPPLPNSATTPVDADDRPFLRAHIETGGQHTEYSAYFDGSQLTEIKEADATYHYRGARLLKYTQSSPQGTKLLELDVQGRVVRATNGDRELAQADIEAIRTRAQLLRSHALAQQASRSHAP